MLLKAEKVLDSKADAVAKPVERVHRSRLIKPHRSHLCNLVCIRKQPLRRRGCRARQRSWRRRCCVVVGVVTVVVVVARAFRALSAFKHLQMVIQVLLSSQKMLSSTTATTACKVSQPRVKVFKFATATSNFPAHVAEKLTCTKTVIKTTTTAVHYICALAAFLRAGNPIP